MFTAPELEVLDTLYKSRTTRVLRARRSDGQHVIVKGPAAGPGTPRLAARLHHEHQILKDLDLPGVVRTYGICETPEGPALLLEDIGGMSLRSLLARGPLPLRTFLEIGIQVTTALGALHEAGVIHKDLNPTNIVVNPETGRVQLIDAGIATRLPREVQEVRSPNQLEGTLPYLSPEQTGRMNRAIDHRSDFYALGMTFYELLTGQLAFRSGDPLELVHCHIAQTPVPPHQLDPRVPKVLSAMVMKLVGKTAEERYQSAYGILADLQRCLQLLDGEGAIRDFPIAERDRSRRLELPQKLYGREAELAALRAAFERACSGGSDGRGAAELVLLSGYSGIGKSSLAAELHKPVLARRGYFTSGKFDPLKRSVPYAALAQALGQLVHQLLLAGDERRAQWRGKVAQALAADAPLLTALVPELARLLGSQPGTEAAPALDSGEAQQRLNAALQRLFRLFAEAGCPLVLVLDDLQWADAASLGLLQALLTAPSPPPLLFVGIYRDNEVGPLHPLILTLDAVRKTALETRHLTLRPLGRADIGALLCDTLRCDPDEAEPLAALLEQKTQGNPFFLSQLLSSLYHDGLLRFDPGSGRWTWSLTQLQRAPITSNVVELLVAKLEQLPDETREILEAAACLGSEFELAELAAVYERTPEQTAAALWQALREGLVAPIGDSFAAQVYARPGAAPWARTERVRYRFLHDRVQQAAYEQIPAIERAALHLKIGRLLWHEAEPEPGAATSALDERLFDILDHLEAGIALVHSQKERLAIARLLLRGGIRAKGALAHELALRLVQLAARLLPEDPRAVPPDLQSALLREQAACAILLGRYAEAEALIDRALAAARTPAERLDAYIQRITLFQRSARYGDALQDGIACLRLYDLELNPKATFEDVERLIGEMKDALGERKPEALLQLPAMTDPDKRALLQVLSNLIAAAWMAGVHVFHSLCMNMGILSIRYGNAPQSAFAYVYAGMVLAVRGDHALGYELGRLACLLVEKDPSCELRGRVLFVYGMNLQYRRHPIRSSLETLLAAYRACIEANDLLYAPWCGQALVNTLFSMGQSLREAHGEMSKWLAYARATNAAGTVDGIVSVGRFFARLLELPVLPALAGESDGSDEAAFEQALLSNPQVGFQFAHFHAKSLLHYVLGDYAAAFSAISDCKPWLPSASMLQEALDHAFYEALIRAALATDPSCEPAQRAAHVAAMRELLAPIRALRAHAPMNFLHKETLIDAELARLSGDGDGDRARAQDLYDRAIALASEQGFLHHAAIANECAARHYLQLGKTTIAGAYLSEAYELYSRWGARKKLAALLAQHPGLIRSERIRRTAPGTEVTTVTSEDLVGLDLLTVTKAAQAISGEIKLERLLAQLMRIVLESAGAERGLLLLRHGEQLRVEAAGRSGSEVEVLRSLPLRGRTDLSEAIVEYVARTGESVVLAHAAQEGAYAADPYIAASRTRSLLCIPAYHHGKLVAVVYLENNLAAGSFTADRVELLQILSAQMAISIDNARLYANLEEKVRERTAELQKAQARLLVLEREATERQLAGGFAHEMRNALAGPKVLLSDVLGLGGDGQEGLPLCSARLLRQIYEACAHKLDEAAQAELKGLLRRVFANEERLDEVLNTVHKAVARGLNTTQRILDYSRTGNESTPPQRLDLNTLCGEVQAELESTLGRHGVRLHSELAPDLPAILGRRPQLHAVLENLILNSRDALIGPGRPEPEPRERLISLRTRRSGSAIEIEVSDNGSGIAPEHLPRIFEPFFSTKPDTGTGLGLALVKKVVSLHQGDIRVQSAPERGTQVTITLPLGAEAGGAGEAP